MADVHLLMLSEEHKVSQQQNVSQLVALRLQEHEAGLEFGSEKVREVLSMVDGRV